MSFDGKEASAAFFIIEKNEEALFSLEIIIDGGWHMPRCTSLFHVEVLNSKNFDLVKLIEEANCCILSVSTCFY